MKVMNFKICISIQHFFISKLYIECNTAIPFLVHVGHLFNLEESSCWIKEGHQ